MYDHNEEKQKAPKQYKVPEKSNRTTHAMQRTKSPSILNFQPPPNMINLNNQ